MPRKKPLILLVEDQSDLRQLYAQQLEQSGFDVIEAGNGADALVHTAEHVPDVVLMDLSLPILDGWEATRTIKSDAKLRRIPIIAVTAHAAKEDWDGIRAAGCDSFLAKPVDEKALFDALQHYLGVPAGA